jgi:hypothetical protein
LTKKDEVTGEYRNLPSEELNILYSSPNTIRQIKSSRMRWAGHVARTEEDRNMYRVLVENPEGKRPLGRPKHSWKDGMRMDLREIGWGDLHWILLAQEWNAWERREKYRVLVGKPEGKRPLGRPKRRWEDGI